MFAARCGFNKMKQQIDKLVTSHSFVFFSTCSIFLAYFTFAHTIWGKVKYCDQVKEMNLFRIVFLRGSRIKESTVPLHPSFKVQTQNPIKAKINNLMRHYVDLKLANPF